MNHAAAATPQRLLRRLLFLAPVVLCGCISIPPSLKLAASGEGAHATESSRLGRLALVRTASYLAGKGDFADASFSSTACQSQRSQARLLIARSIPRIDGEATCSRLLAAADYVWKLSPEKAPIRYQFELYPDDQTVTRRSLSIYPLAGRVLYAFRWTSADQSLPEIVDTVSHESLHLAASLAGLPANRRHDEAPAYLAGACAQLEVLGYIDARRQQFAFKDSENVPSNARESGAAAAATWQSLRTTAPDGVIRLGSPEGSAQHARCMAALIEFFKMNR